MCFICYVIKKKAETVQPQKSAYVSLEVLELLHCPLCQKRLSLKDADIESQGIFKGDLLCDCGYHAVISDGMVLCEGAAEDTPFKVFDNVTLFCPLLMISVRLTEI